MDSNETPENFGSKDDFSSSYSETIEDLQKNSAISIAASGKGRYGIVKASASAEYNKLREETKNTRNVYYSIQGTRTYKLAVVKTPILSKKGEKLFAKAIASGKPKKFTDICGKYYVAAVAKKTTIGLVYKFVTTSESEKEKVKKALSAFVSGSIGKLETSTNIMNEVAKVSASTTSSVAIFYNGASDKKNALGLAVLEKPGALNEIVEHLKTAMNELGWGTSDTLSVILGSMREIESDNSIENIAQTYQRLDPVRIYAEALLNRYLKLQDVISDSGQGYYEIKQGKKQIIDAELISIEKELDTLVAEIEKCLAAESSACNIPTKTVNPRIIDMLDVKLVDFGQWNSRVVGASWNPGPKFVAATVAFWPEFRVSNMKFVRKVELFDGEYSKAELSSTQIANLLTEQRLSFENINPIILSYAEYCFQGNDRHCQEWADNYVKHKQDLKNKNHAKLRLVVTDIEGNTYKVDVPELASVPDAFF